MSQVPPPPPPSFNPPPPGFQPGGASGSAEHPKGTMILVFGILSLICCFPLGIAAIIMGNNALAEMNANPSVTYTNRGNVTAGRICGIIGVVLWAIGIVINLSLR